MGCRPSRRTVACVRVAEEVGPWGVSRSSRPIDNGEAGGVRLRRKSSNKQVGANGEGMRAFGGNPRDRYSAPPAPDRVFPPHSCTTATYEHGCCGTSRITLRLSKNGSTLEIEKCDFDHGLKTCKVCSPTNAAPPNPAILCRTQSAPNLSVIPSIDKVVIPPPLPPRAPLGQVVKLDSNPSVSDEDSDKLARRYTASGGDSSQDSSMNTSVVKVDVERSELLPTKPNRHRQCVVQTNYSFTPESPVHTRAQGPYTDKIFSERLLSKEPQSISPDSLSEDILSVHSSTHSLQSLHVNHMEKETSYLLRNADKISHTNWTNHTMKEAVDLTTFYHVGNHLFVDDLGMNCASAECAASQEIDCVGNCLVDKTEAVCKNAKLSFDCLSSPFHEDNHHDSVRKRDHYPQNHGVESDYRVRMLTANSDNDKIVFSGCSGTVDSAATDMDVGSSQSQVLVSIHSNQIPADMSFGPMMTVSGDGAVGFCTNGEFINKTSLAFHERLAACSAPDDMASRKLMLVAGHGSLEHDCEDPVDSSISETDEEEDRSLGTACLEMVPAYVHADFKNDFEDLFDDSSPELDTA